jgi:hypothetical protein
VDVGARHLKVGLKTESPDADYVSGDFFMRKEGQESNADGRNQNVSRKDAKAQRDFLVFCGSNSGVRH